LSTIFQPVSARQIYFPLDVHTSLDHMNLLTSEAFNCNILIKNVVVGWS